jgi:YbgC/YbaW family acyl-CoA thioester hydrolase
MAERPRPSREELVQAPTVIHAERRFVNFQDIDAAGIIFFARVLEYFHDAFMGFTRRIGLDFPAVLRERQWGTPVVHAEADYLNPMQFGDEVVVELVRADLGERSMTLGYRVRALDGRPLAVGHMVHVCVEFPFRSRPLPDALRAALTAPAGATGASSA